MPKDLRNPFRVIYQSSYDRGLEHLLKIWPDVKKAVPEAELHVFYGWTLFERFYRDNPERMAWKNKIDRLMEADGVVHRGRVPQHEIQKEIEKSAVWAYPSHFGEISCISAMRSQAGGAIPVVTNYAALETTVQHGAKVDGDIFDPDTRDRFKLALIDMLKDPEMQEKIRKPMMKWAKNEFKWSKVASDWSEEFKK